MSRPRTTVGKRQIQQHKRERAQAKQERKAARRVEDGEAVAPVVEATESELIAQLAAVHTAAETAAISPEEFETRREQIRRQLEQLEQLESRRQ